MGANPWKPPHRKRHKPRMRRQHVATNISGLGGSRPGRSRFGMNAAVAAFAAWLFTSIPTVGFTHGYLLPPYSRRRPKTPHSRLIRGVGRCDVGESFLSRRDDIDSPVVSRNARGKKQGTFDFTACLRRVRISACHVQHRHHRADLSTVSSIERIVVAMYFTKTMTLPLS
jgi:hypothetical protein